MAIKYSTTHRANRATQLNTDIGTSCLIKLYSGTRPASVDTAITSQVLLATLTGNASAFGTVANGPPTTLTANAITSGTGTAGAGTGTNATWFRVFKSDGTTAVMDGDVGNGSGDLQLNNVSIATGQTVSCTSWVITIGNQ